MYRYGLIDKIIVDKVPVYTLQSVFIKGTGVVTFSSISIKELNFEIDVMDNCTVVSTIDNNLIISFKINGKTVMKFRDPPMDTYVNTNLHVFVSKSTHI